MKICDLRQSYKVFEKICNLDFDQILNVAYSTIHMKTKLLIRNAV